MACTDIPRQLVLCFDGTGNTIQSDGTNTNIVKIFSLLDQNNDNQLCYYQPGIGTDVNLAGLTFHQKSPIFKIFDLALAPSFKQHVIAGYQFLMRRWRPGDQIYLFGFSRGAFTARFLSEMLDLMGVLRSDNEQMLPYLWEVLVKWRFSLNGTREESNETFRSLRFTRDMMCRDLPEPGVYFLGLFDTVNSVAEFSNTSTLQPAANIIRHAVSLDERRIKFQPVLFGPMLERMRTEQKRKTGEQYCELPSPYKDIEEVYFAGDHSDVGGGWKMERDHRNASDIPLLWMVNEAMRAGLTFDTKKLQTLGYDLLSEKHSELNKEFLQIASLSPLHNSLARQPGEGIGFFFWRFIECLPFKRLRTRPDGGQEMSRRPVVKGIRRHIPENSKIHASVLRRLKNSGVYRGNVIQAREFVPFANDGKRELREYHIMKY